MQNWSKRPIVFDNNRITRPYIGGKLINEWRKMEPSEDGHQCEELLVTSIGAICKGQPEGYAISKTVGDGVLLTDIIASDPAGILGAKYQAENPNHLSVLARAGDTIVRLVLQCHPNKADAKKYFGAISGKTEAWYIARTRDLPGLDNCVYAGFIKGVTPAAWKDLIDKQDVAKMVALLHKIPVHEGSVVLIPSGMPHAVGPGCIFLELHECSDITIRVEKNVNGMDLTNEEMYNGLDSEDGLKLFDYTTYTEDEIKKRCVMVERNRQNIGDSYIVTAIDEKNTNDFGMDIAYISKELNLPDFDGHRILIPVDQDLILSCEAGEFEVVQGHGCLLPANLKNLKMRPKVGNTAKAVIGLPRA